MKDKKIYFWGGALLFLALLLHSCQAIIPDNIGKEKKSITYLQINMTGITMPGSITRAQGNDPSINTDASDYEDYVGELAVLVYNAATGKQVKAQFTTSSSFVLELEPEEGALYHFCFIANYFNSWRETLQGLHTYQGLKNELMDPRAFWGTGKSELYDGATPQNLFPMARIYENQTVTKGGSFATPVPFKPTTSVVGSLLPISNWPSDKESSTILSSINLIRTGAKVSVKLIGDGLNDVKSISLSNISSNHTYMESIQSNSSFRTLYFKGHNQIGQLIPVQNNVWTSSMYIPENLLGPRTSQLYWDNVNDSPVGGLTYIRIEMKGGQAYHIPVIVNYQNTMVQEYIDYAKGTVGGFTPDYSIVRNHEYHFDIILPSKPTDIDLKINYWVKPWDTKNISIFFD